MTSGISSQPSGIRWFSDGGSPASRRVLKDTGAIWVIGSYHNIFRLGKDHDGSGVLDLERYCLG